MCNENMTSRCACGPLFCSTLNVIMMYAIVAIVLCSACDCVNRSLTDGAFYCRAASYRPQSTNVPRFIHLLISALYKLCLFVSFLPSFLSFFFPYTSSLIIYFLTGLPHDLSVCFQNRPVSFPCRRS